MHQRESGSSLRAMRLNANAKVAWRGWLPAERTASIAVPSFPIPCKLVAGVSRRSAAPGSQFVEWSAQGRARLRAWSRMQGSSSPNPMHALVGSARSAAVGASAKSGSSRRGAELSGLGLQSRMPVLARFLVCQGLCPNQSLEPTRVGRPPLAAQLQRCASGCRESK